MANKTLRIGKGCSVRLIRDVYQVRWHDPQRQDRKNIQHSLLTDDLGLAVERARKLYQEWTLGLYDPWTRRRSDGTRPHADLSINDALVAFRRERKGEIRDRTIDDYEGLVRSFVRDQLGFPRTQKGVKKEELARRRVLESELADWLTIATVSKAKLKSFIYGAHLASATQARHHRVLRAWFQWAVESGRIARNPVDDISKPRAGDVGAKYLSESEVERVLTAIEHHVEVNKAENGGHCWRKFENPLWLHHAVDLIRSTGLRRAEAARLEWRHVLYPEEAGGAGFLWVESAMVRTKSGDSRMVTMIPRAETLLRRLEAETRRTDDPQELVLKAADGEKGITADYLSTRFRMMSDEAKVRRVGIHGLRHSFAVELLRLGASVVTIKDELGHKELKTVMKYLNVSPDDRAESVLKLFR